MYRTRFFESPFRFSKQPAVCSYVYNRPWQKHQTALLFNSCHLYSTVDVQLQNIYLWRCCIQWQLLGKPRQIPFEFFCGWRVPNHMSSASMELFGWLQMWVPIPWKHPGGKRCPGAHNDFNRRKYGPQSPPLSDVTKRALARVARPQFFPARQHKFGFHGFGVQRGVADLAGFEVRRTSSTQCGILRRIDTKTVLGWLVIFAEA